jgi:hypothetical protein
MERRKAFATAGAVSVTALAAVVALGANMGLFGLAREGGPGHFKLVDNTQQQADVRTEVVDVPVPAPEPAPTPGSGGAARSSTPTAGAPAAPTPAASSGGSLGEGHEPEGAHEREPGDGADD